MQDTASLTNDRLLGQSWPVRSRQSLLLGIHDSGSGSVVQEKCSSAYSRDGGCFANCLHLKVAPLDDPPWPDIRRHAIGTCTVSQVRNRPHCFTYDSGRKSRSNVSRTAWNSAAISPMD